MTDKLSRRWTIGPKWMEVRFFFSWGTQAGVRLALNAWL
jgi:hypothetical protein